MNEQERNSQVSALFDGELDSAQAEFVSRRLLKDPALRASWSRYATIGASLRGDPLSVPSRGRGDLADRVRLALEREAALDVEASALGDPAVPGPAFNWRTMAWGSGLAAGVALMAIIVMRNQAPLAPEPLTANVAAEPVSAVRVPMAAEPVQVAREALAPPSYTTPVDSRPSSVRPATPLVNYVVAHSEYTTPVVRLSPLSTVISGNFDPTENTVEMTAAEVGARR